MTRKELHFTSSNKSLALESKPYHLCDITVLDGGKLEGYKLNIVSYILPVKSDIPIIFVSLPDLKYLDKEETSATFLVKLNFIDKSNIQLIITPPYGVTNYELKIGYYEF